MSTAALLPGEPWEKEMFLNKESEKVEKHLKYIRFLRKNFLPKYMSNTDLDQLTFDP